MPTFSDIPEDHPYYDAYTSVRSDPFFWKNNRSYNWTEWQAFGQDPNGTFN